MIVAINVFYFSYQKVKAMKKIENADFIQGLHGGRKDTVIDIVTGACAGITIVGLFGGPVAWGAVAFCAGWSLGAAIKEIRD
jgi:hypothetical protein